MFNHWHHDSGRRSLQPDLYEAFCAGLDVQQSEIDRLRTELRHVAESCKVFREEAQRMQAGVERIRDASGACCETYETCDHPPCEGSVGAHLIALEILK